MMIMVNNLIRSLSGLNTIHNKVAYFGPQWEVEKVCVTFLA